MKHRIEYLFTFVLVTGIKLAYDILELAKNMRLNIPIHTKINNMKELNFFFLKLVSVGISFGKLYNFNTCPKCL